MWRKLSVLFLKLEGNLEDTVKTNLLTTLIVYQAPVEVEGTCLEGSTWLITVTDQCEILQITTFAACSNTTVLEGSAKRRWYSEEEKSKSGC
jgi:hypothetical protein